MAAFICLIKNSIKAKLDDEAILLDEITLDPILKSDQWGIVEAQDVLFN